MDGVEDELEAVGDAQLGVDAGEVVLDGGFADAELVGDFFVAQAHGDAADNFHLAAGEAGVALPAHARGRGRLRDQRLQRLAQDGVVDPNFAVVNFADAFGQPGRVGRMVSYDKILAARLPYNSRISLKILNIIANDFPHFLESSR